MYPSVSIERFYAPFVAYWWLGMIAGLQWWGALSDVSEPERPHLRLVADHGKLVETS